MFKNGMYILERPIDTRPLTVDIDFYQELEFYEWLAVNEQAVS